MAKHGPDQGWREHVLGMLPKMEATAEPLTGVQQATAADFGPIVYRGDRTPDDAAALLPEAAATKLIAIEQRFADLSAQVPSFEDVREIRLEAFGYKNRIAELTKHRSEGGFEQDPSAPQVISETRKLERAEKELARRTELKETRTIRVTAVGQLRQSLKDWVLRGIPGGVTLDVVEDTPVSELMTKADGGRVETAIERFRHRQRECVAERHRVNSQQWPVSVAEAGALELIERRLEAGRPVLESAIEHNLPISFAKMRLQSQVYNAQPGAVAFAEPEDAIGFVFWLLGKEFVLEKIRAGFREIADGDALDERQRAEMLAAIDADDMAAQRAECSLIWAFAAKGEVIDFRPTTSPQAVLGVRLITVPRAASPTTSPGHAYDIIQPGGGRR